MESETRLDFLDLQKASGLLDNFLVSDRLCPCPPPCPSAPLASTPEVSAELLSTIDVEAYLNTMDYEEIKSTLIATIEGLLDDQGLVVDAEVPALASVGGPSVTSMPASIPAQELRGNQPEAHTVVSHQIHMPTLGPYAPTTSPQMMDPAGTSSILHPFGKKRQRDSVDSNVKKPLNAFMLYRAEQRLKIQEELNITNSATVNKEVGRCWASLSEEEKAPYFEQANKLRKEHQALYPDWSFKDNYGKNKKRKMKNISAESAYGPIMRMSPYAPDPFYLAPSYQPQTVHVPSCCGPDPWQL